MSRFVPKRLILFNQSSGRMFLELAAGLSDNYLNGAVLFSGISLDLDREGFVKNSLRVLPAPVYDRRSRLHRAFSWLAYSLYVACYILFARRGDVFLLVSNPPILAPWVWLLTRLRKVPYAVLVYDIYPDVLIKAGVLKSDGLVARLWIAINRVAYANSRAVITIGFRMAKVIEQQIACKNDSNVHVIPLWADVDSMRPLSKDKNPIAADYVPPGKTVVVYSGNMGAGHDIGSILEAARLLRNDSDFFFLLIGGGEWFVHAQEFAETHGLENLKVLPWQPVDKFRFILPLADIALVALDEGMEDLMVPSKSFSYMAAGCALVAISNEPSELSDLLSLGSFGIRIPPRSPQLLAAAIRDIAKNKDQLRSMRLEARCVVERYHSQEMGLLTFKTVLAKAGLLPIEVKSHKND